MKICRNCSRPFDKQQDLDYGPARELGDIFLRRSSADDDEELCPDCREKLGVSNLLGFDL